MLRKSILACSIVAGAAIATFSFPSVTLAGPKIESHGTHGASMIVAVPMMDESFPMMSEKLGMAVTPFNLVFLGYQGFFIDEDIPSAQELIQAYRQGSLKPMDLIQAAVKMNRLMPESLQDKTYEAQVRSQLELLAHGDN